MPELDIKDVYDIDISQTIHSKSSVEVSSPLNSINDNSNFSTYCEIYNTFTYTMSS